MEMLPAWRFLLGNKCTAIIYKQVGRRSISGDCDVLKQIRKMTILCPYGICWLHGGFKVFAGLCWKACHSHV